jgi:hypothetical protein
MKKLSLNLLMFLLFSTIVSFHPVSAQEKSKEELEKDVMIQQAIEKQKKVMADHQKAMENAMTEHQKAMADARQAFAEQQVTPEDSVIDIWDAGRRAEEKRAGMRYFNQRGNRSFLYGEPFFKVPGPEGFYGPAMGDAESTTWDFSKSVKENSFSEEYSFNVEKTVKTVIMSVMGDCKKGEISIKILMPGGKTYSDILIDESGNLNWRKSFNISKSENQDKAGDWKFKIDSDKATGFFKISLQAY